MESDRDAHSHPPSSTYFWKRHDKRLRRSPRHCHYWRQKISNLRFADNIDGLAGEDGELANLVERLDKFCTAYGMEISAEKTTWMKNSTSGINKEIKVNGQRAGSDKLQ